MQSNDPRPVCETVSLYDAVHLNKSHVNDFASSVAEAAKDYLKALDAVRAKSSKPARVKSKPETRSKK